jgi:hypothetical protein
MTDTNDGSPKLDSDFLGWMNTAYGSRSAEYTDHRAYYDGKQGVKLSDRMKLVLRVPENEFSANFCASVVHAMTDRLKVTGFDDGSGADSDAGDLLGWLNGVMDTNRFDGLQVGVHESVAILGDSYVIGEFDESLGADGGVRLAHNDASLIRVQYDPNDANRMLWASKRWTVGDITYLTVYYPDRIERWISRSGSAAWQPRIVDDEEWPTPWLLDGQPAGIPVVHFRNRARYGQGVSEIAGIKGLQNNANKTLVDLMAVLDTNAFSPVYTVDIAKPRGSLNVHPGAVWQFRSTAAEGRQGTVGTLPPVDPNGILQSFDKLVEIIGAVTSTPTHLIWKTDQFPSGEALKTAEAPLLAKIENRQTLLGNAWEYAMRVAWTVGKLAGLSTPDWTEINAVWHDPSPRSESNHLASLEAKERLGVPRTQLWREMGYSEDQVALMIAAQEDERARESNIGAEILRRASEGQGTPATL